MKSLKLLAFAMAVLGVSLAACNQSKTVAPSKVTEAFNKEFPTAIDISWAQEDAGWEAEFKLDGFNYSADYTSDGVWKETEHELSLTKISSTVKSALDKNFAGFTVEEAGISESADSLVYEFDIKKADMQMEVAITADGKVVRQEIKGK